MTAQLHGEAKPDLSSRAITIGLLIAIVFTALAYGAVEPWAVALFEIIVLMLVLPWAIKIIADRRIELTIPRAALPIAGVVAIGLAQSVAITGRDGTWHSLSMNVEFTRAAVTVLIFLLISMVIAANFLTTRKQMSAIATFLTFFGLAIAVFALVQHFTWNGRFYWLRRNTVSTSPFGPFVNHNHFAGYMEMLIPIPVALVVTRAVRGEMRLLYGFAAMMMGVATVVSLSRGGMISLVAGLAFIL